MELILGSQSPRRAEILRFFNLPFKQIAPDFDEDSVLFEQDPEKYAAAIAKGKLDSFNLPNDTLLLTADTVVYSEGEVFGKPKDEKEAAAFLKKLSGKWHTVCTALAASCGNKRSLYVEKTNVLLNPLSDQQIKNYHLAFPCMDKAGAFQIQAGGSIIVNQIEGCYYNVIGLPINALVTILSDFDIDLWKRLR